MCGREQLMCTWVQVVPEARGTGSPGSGVRCSHLTWISSPFSNACIIRMIIEYWWSWNGKCSALGLEHFNLSANHSTKCLCEGLGYVHWCVYGNVCAYMWKPEDKPIILPQASSSLFYKTLSLWNLELTNPALVHGQGVPGSAMSTSDHWDMCVHYHISLVWVLRIRFRSPCLPGKHLTNWPVSTAPVYI